MAGNTVLRIIPIMLFTLAFGGCYREPHVHLGTEALAVGSDGDSAAVSEASPLLRIAAQPDFAEGVAPHITGLSLREAVRRAVRFSPAVQAALIEIDAKRAETTQAGLRPNPSLEADVQNVGQDVQESTLELSQVFELGGKRLKRIRVAELDAGVAAWDYEAARLRVASDAAQTFVDVLASQERIKILDELAKVAESLSVAARERVKAGTVSPVEDQRAQIEVTRAKAQLREEQALLGMAKRRLANLWGSQSADFEFAQGELKTPNHIPSPEQVSVYLESNPEVARWMTEMTRRRAILSLAKATAIPDIELGAGARHLEEADETGAVVRMSIPLPLFNRNQGNIAAAETRITKGLRESLSARTDVNSVFLEAFGRLLASAEKLKALETEILPSAREIYAATSQGYAEGKFDLLSVLDAQRTLFSTRLEIINARADFQKAKTQIEALIGRGLYDV